MTDHVTNTEEVKSAYHWFRYYRDPRFRYNLKCLEEFDNWLREELAKAWDNGRLSRPEQENPHR